MSELQIKILLVLAFYFLGVLQIAGLLSWVERKQSALMQDRLGANRASIVLPWWWARPINWLLRPLIALGLLHPLADVIKMLTKEDFTPPGGNRLLHTLAPLVSLFFALVAFAAIPFGNTLTVGGHVINLQIADVNAGLLYTLALASLGVYGVILAGVSSNNNYALIGGMRAASQMLAYEITMGVALMGAVMWYGTLDLQEMVRRQGAYCFGWIPNWGVVTQPLACILFTVAGLAETKRVPFDLPEGESEIIGYFVEYSGMKFGMFFLTDFVETVLIGALATVLFFGGWQVPYLGAAGFVFPWGASLPLAPLVVSLLGIGSFVFKVVAFQWLFMTIRWTLPRFRYDQLMHLGWKILFPASLVNIGLTGLLVALRG